MKKILGAALTACALTALSATAAGANPAGASSAGTNRSAVAQYIVVLKDGVAASAVTGHASRHGLAPTYVYTHALHGYAARMSQAAAQRLSADPQVASVQLDRPVHIDAQTLPTGIDRIDGELSSTVSGNGSGSVNVDVAVIDTGVQFNHPDLNVFTAGAMNCSSGNSAKDGNGHGTHVSGTIAAKDDANGVVGVAPGARIWPVRVLDNSGSGTTVTVVCGIDYVTQHAAEIEVANMSLGGFGADDGNCGFTNNDAMHQAICASVAAGVTYAVAAGNDADNAANHVPAAYDEVITVSALADFDGQPGGLAAPTCRPDVDDTFADFSNFGPDVDLIAPGVCIFSTYLRRGYATLSGTSMATPHVAGAAALYKSNNPLATPAQVKSALQAAGNFNWTGDPDGTQEPLLNVDAF